MIRAFNTFVKVTGFVLWWFLFRPKVYYKDKKVQGRNIKGAAIIMSNHTSVFDYALFLGIFLTRTLRYQMAEVLFRKKLLGWFLRRMGGIFVNRDTYNFSFVDESVDILNKGGVVGVFPEARLPRKGEESPLPFKPSGSMVALKSGAPIIPVYTDGVYFSAKRARLIIGTPIYAKDYYDESLSEKENIKNISKEIRNIIVELKDELEREKQK